MDIFLDDSLVDSAFVGDGSVEDVLRHVQDHLCQCDQLVVGVRCNGEDMQSNAMTEVLQKPASSYERMEIFTETKDALVTDALAQASTCLTDTEEACRNAAELFVQGQAVDASAMLVDCLRVWQQIHEAVAQSIQLLRLDPEQVMVDDEPLIELIARPKDILVDAKEALTAQDYVLLADILQYEFPKVTQTWHTLIGRLQREAEDMIAGCGS